MDEYLEKLRFFFDDGLLLAGLDLVDCDSGEQNVVDFLHLLSERRSGEIPRPLGSRPLPSHWFFVDIHRISWNLHRTPSRPCLLHLCILRLFHACDECTIYGGYPFRPVLCFVLRRNSSHDADKHFTQCKHTLATYLAERMGRCVERTLSVDDLAAISIEQATVR